MTGRRETCPDSLLPRLWSRVTTSCLPDAGGAAPVGYEELIPAGVVLTGGTSKMEGAVDLAEEIFHMPVRVGAPQYARGLHDIIRNPIYATAVGLLLYGQKKPASGDGAP